MADKIYQKMRGTNDRTIEAALTDHVSALRAILGATSMLLRERRLLLAWVGAMTVAVVYLLVVAPW
jgi:hypothetical protein